MFNSTGSHISLVKMSVCVRRETMMDRGRQRLFSEEISRLLAELWKSFLLELADWRRSFYWNGVPVPSTWLSLRSILALAPTLFRTQRWKQRITWPLVLVLFSSPLHSAINFLSFLLLGRRRKTGGIKGAFSEMKEHVTNTCSQKSFHFTRVCRWPWATTSKRYYEDWEQRPWKRTSRSSALSTRKESTQASGPAMFFSLDKGGCEKCHDMNIKGRWLSVLPGEWTFVKMSSRGHPRIKLTLKNISSSHNYASKRSTSTRKNYLHVPLHLWRTKQHQYTCRNTWVAQRWSRGAHPWSYFWSSKLYLLATD